MRVKRVAAGAARAPTPEAAANAVRVARNRRRPAVGACSAIGVIGARIDAGHDVRQAAPHILLLRRRSTR